MIINRNEQATTTTTEAATPSKVGVSCVLLADVV